MSTPVDINRTKTFSCSDTTRRVEGRLVGQRVGVEVKNNGVVDSLSDGDVGPVVVETLVYTQGRASDALEVWETRESYWEGSYVVLYSGFPLFLFLLLVPFNRQISCPFNWTLSDSKLNLY